MHRMAGGGDDDVGREHDVIADIAFAVGFGTSSYFIERFRKNYGISPYAFRKQLRAQGENTVNA